jgi:23S rRNA pseudouridine955/2504/2580 synthase
LAAGQRIRVPPQVATCSLPSAARPAVVSAADRQSLSASILYADAEVVVIDKPAGLAVQGGSGTERHLDGMLDVFRADGERPRLVHRLDKDTSGVLVLARTAAAAAALALSFRTRSVRKLYWALVIGQPPAAAGRIDVPLAKQGGAGGERMVAETNAGSRAVTDYRVVERAGRRVAWLALEPLTGRTHQLRAHCAALGTPILGDGKYGGRNAFLAGARAARRLHLHARAIRFCHPDGRIVTAVAPLPAHMRETWAYFGFDADSPAATPANWQADESADDAGRPGRDRS